MKMEMMLHMVCKLVSQNSNYGFIEIVIISL